MKNYYEILEIDKNASQEIIDKAHKVLVKKYHPDLQNTEEEKTKSEAKIKEINEAYEVLSNKEKRAEYDNSLKKAEEIEQDMKNRGYKIKYKKTWNERLRSLIALLITIGIIMLILQIPFVKNYFHSLYSDNEIIRNIVDGISNWFH